MGEYLYGHEVKFNEETELHHYVDTGEIATVPSKRPCPQCHKLPTPEGHDACLGTIEGVYAACCGHGVETGYIAWEAARSEVAVEVWLPRWIVWLLRFTGYTTPLDNPRDVTVVYRHDIVDGDTKGNAVSRIS